MNASCACITNALADAVMPAGFCAFALPVSIDKARSVLALPGGPNLLALERGTQSVVLMEDTDDDGIPDTKRVVASAPGLNHGMALYEDYLYASSDTHVYRWPWNADTLSVTEDSSIIINNINADGNGGAPQGHTTRTLEFDSNGLLYVSVGSNENVDPDSFRSRIRRFNITSSPMNSSTLPSASEESLVPNDTPAPSSAPSESVLSFLFPTTDSQQQPFPAIDFSTGEVFADGIRNAVAMAHDANGVLWAADTGADNLQREDLGGDITDDNPAEELHRIPEQDAGTHYGYPYCWTEYRLDAPYTQGRGTAFAWPGFNVTDEDCRTKYGQAVVAMQAHSTPLGITFYNYKPPEERPGYCPGGAFPKSMNGYIFIAFHGSWNRRIPTGYKVVYVKLDADGNKLSEPIDLLAHVPPNAKWDDGFRPVDVDFDECGRLLLSSDGDWRDGYAGAKIVRIESIAEQCDGDNTPVGAMSAEEVATSTSSSAAHSCYKWTVCVGLSLIVGAASLVY